MMTPPFVRNTWYGLSILDKDGDHVCDAAGENELQAVLSALNHRPGCVRLQASADGVWAHFHVPGGVYWSLNLSVSGTMACRFALQYRDWLALQNPPQDAYLDTFDEHDACDAWAGLPIEFFNPGPSFA